MKHFFSTFTTGFSDVVRTTLKKELPDIKIDLLLDGLIVYQTDCDFSKIENLRFLNNTFGLIHYFKNSTKRPFLEMKDWLRDNDFSSQLNSIPREIESLQTVFMEKNEYTHLDKIFRDKLTRLLEEKTKLPVVRKDGQTELWLIDYKDNYSFIGVRLTVHAGFEKDLARGELAPQMAHLLVLLSNPDKNDIFLDPFTGSGAIPQERAISFPFKLIIASDTDQNLINNLKKSFTNKNVQVLEQDMFHLVELAGEKSVTKIVTDPPWGLHGHRINIGTFYPQMFSVFCEILQKNGILVLMVSRVIDIEKILIPFSNKLRLEQKVNTLVNGEKATVFKLKKIL